MSRRFRILHGEPEAVEDMLNEINNDYDLNIAGLTTNPNLGTVTMVVCYWKAWTRFTADRFREMSDDG